MKFPLLLFVGLASGACWPGVARAQTGSIQDCLGAIPVCQKIYVEDQAPLGFGTQSDFNPSFTCIVEESNSIWYTFTVNKSGKFGFLLTPHDPIVDYDWILFNITNAGCNDLFYNQDLVVSCNSAGGDGCHGPTGATGDTQYANQGPNCGNLPPDQTAGYSPINDLIDVEAGNTYVLCIINFTASSAGYTIDFGLSTDIGIFDETPPAVDQVAFSGDCSGESLALTFTEYIQCATIDAGLFQLSGPGGPYNLSLSGANCSNGGNFEKRFDLQISPPVTAPGNYTLTMTTDGATQVLDLCDLPAVSQSTDFQFGSSSLSFDLGPDTTLCPGQTLVLDPGIASADYHWQDGSSNTSLTVTSPGTYAVTISTGCASAGDTIVVAFQSGPPAFSLGPDTVICSGAPFMLDATTPSATSYQWQDGSMQPSIPVTAPGRYSVRVGAACWTISDTIQVGFDQPPGPIELGNDTLLCPGSSLVLNAQAPSGATTLWQDGTTGPTLTVVAPGTYAAMVVSGCGTAQDEIEVDYVPAVDVRLPDTVLCEGAILYLDATAAGAGYLWQDGTTGPVYAVTEPGGYSVTITTACESKTLSAKVTGGSPAPFVDLGPDTVLCAGEILVYEIDGNGAGLLWQDGSTDGHYEITEPGIYSLEISNECGTAADEIGVEVIKPFALDLGRDTFLCPGEVLLLDAGLGADTYEWQDGSDSPTITVRTPGQYTVLATSPCQTETASIEVAACEFCNIYAPNAFSPNDDGVNDYFILYSDCELMDFDLKIFDRWGGLLYEGFSPYPGWNGKQNNRLISNGLYVYVATYKVAENGRISTYQTSGDIMLVR